MNEPGPPGWYPDPWGTSKQRWFDGGAWTQQVWPPDAPPTPAPAAPARPATGWAQEQRVGRALVAVMPLAAVAFIATAVSVVAVTRWIADNWSEVVEAAEAGRRLEPVLPDWVATLSWVGQFPLLAIQVLFIVWCYRAARVGAELGYPARRAPGWAIGSWLVPVLNLWWPYQCVADTVPADDPARTTIRRWWSLWIATLACSVPVLASSFLPVSVSAVAIGIQGLLALAAALAARGAVAAVLAVHAGAARGSA